VPGSLGSVGDRPAAARRAAREALSRYMQLETTSTAGQREGSVMTISPGAARSFFLDAMVAWATRTRSAHGSKQHWDAGADHVCIQPVKRAGVRGRSSTTEFSNCWRPPADLDAFRSASDMVD